MDPVQAAALNELLKSGAIGAFLVLTIVGSMTGTIKWGPTVRELVASKDEQIRNEREDKIEAVTGWRAQIDATNRVAAALEIMNALLRDRSRGT